MQSTNCRRGIRFHLGDYARITGRPEVNKTLSFLFSDHPTRTRRFDQKCVLEARSDGIDDDLEHIDDNERDVVLLLQRSRLPKTYFREQLIR